MKYLLGAVIYFISLIGYAQVQTLERGLLYWTRYYVEWEIAEKFQLDSELDNRRIFSPFKQFKTLARTTLSYKPSNNFNFGGGISYLTSYSLYTNTIQPEIRPHQEANLNHGGNQWSFNHRIRIEQRFQGDTTRTIKPSGEIIEENASTHSFDIRTRYEFATDFALKNKDKEKDT